MRFRSGLDRAPEFVSQPSSPRGRIFGNDIKTNRKDENAATDNKLQPVFKIRIVHTLNNSRHHEAAKERTEN